MNKTYIYLAFFCLCLSLKTTAQEAKFTPDPSYSDDIRHREIIMNTTPLIAQFVPFNASSISKFNLFDFQYRKMRNGRGTRWGLGVNVEGDFNPVDPQNFYLRFGFIKRRQISEHFHFARSWDVNLVAEDTDNQGNPRGKFGFNGFAVSYSAAFEYSINSFLTLSTEGSLFIGLINIDFGTPKIKFIPPVGLFLHVKF